MSYGFAA
jgi:Mrp family chromosome partitioning ATPase